MKFLEIKHLQTHSLIQKKSNLMMKKIDEILDIQHNQLSARVEK